MKKNLRFFFLLILPFLLSFCGGFGSGGGKIKYPNKVASEWRTEFNQAEKAFEAKNYNEAEKLYKNYSQKYPYNELTDKSQFRLGQIAMVREDYPHAIQIFKAIIRKTPDPALKAKANAKLGISYYRQNNYGEALSAFAAVDEKQIDERELVKTASFGVRASQELKEDLNKQAYYYAVLLDHYEPLSETEVNSRFGKEIVSKSEVKPKLKDWVALVTPYEILDRRLLDYKGKQSEPYVDFKIGKSAYESKNNRKAKEYLERYLSKNPGGEYGADANKMLASLGSSTPSTRKKNGGVPVGAILPLSGKYEQYGNNTFRGMECAASLKPECHALNNIDLVVKDSEGNGGKAASLVTNLVSQEKAVAILGPLPSVEVDEAVKQAQKEGVVLIALSQKKEINGLGNNIFRFSLTPAIQVETLLQYATGKKRAKTFGVLYPKSNYGQEFLAEFERQVSRFQGKVVAKEGFTPGTTDFSSVVQKLKSKSREQKPFDALFIPDSYLTVGKVAPALAQADLGNILALGPNAWNDSSLPDRIGPNLKEAVFVDIYFRDSNQSSVESFVREFQSAYSYSPSTLEAMGYDAMRIAGEAISKSKVSNKEEMKSALLKIRNFQGVTGLRGFETNGEARVQPYLLRVDGNGIKEIR